MGWVEQLRKTCFDVSIPIRLIWSTDGLLCLRSTHDLILAHSMPPGAVHTNNSDTGGEFDVRRMFQSEQPLINPDGAAQASLGAAPAGRGRQSCEFATSVNSHVTSRQIGKYPRNGGDQVQPPGQPIC